MLSPTPELAQDPYGTTQVLDATIEYDGLGPVVATRRSAPSWPRVVLALPTGSGTY